MLTKAEQQRLLQCESLLHLYKDIVRNVEMQPDDIDDLNKCASKIAVEWVALSRKQGE